MKNWYIVQSYSSFENKVAQNIKEEAEKAKISEKIEEIIVPTHDITTAITNTIKAPCNVSFHVGHETLKASCLTS